MSSRLLELSAIAEPPADLQEPITDQGKRYARGEELVVLTDWIGPFRARQCPLEPFPVVRRPPGQNGPRTLPGSTPAVRERRRLVVGICRT